MSKLEEANAILKALQVPVKRQIMGEIFRTDGR